MDAPFHAAYFACIHEIKFGERGGWRRFGNILILKMSLYLPNVLCLLQMFWRTLNKYFFKIKIKLRYFILLAFFYRME